MWEITYSYLVSFSVHIGHSIKNSSPFCAWMVLAKRQEILLINLYKWTFMMHWGLTVFEAAVLIRSPVWFITLDPLKAVVVRLAANYSGEFNVTAGWISGLLSNYYMICLSWAKNRLLASYVRPARQKRLADIYDNWMVSRISWPRAVFLCGVQKSFRVARESIKARIPCVSIADTLGGHQALSLAVPGNDDTMDSIYFHNFLASKTILRKKYTQVFSWYYHVRCQKRLSNFAQWFAHLTMHRKKEDKPYNYLLWNNPYGFSERVMKYSMKQSNFLTTASLLNAITNFTAKERKLETSEKIYHTYEAEHLQFDSPEHKDVLSHFLQNKLIYGALLKLNFMNALGSFFRQGVTKALNDFRPHKKSYVRKGMFVAKRESNFLNKRHHFFDLLTSTNQLLRSPTTSRIAKAAKEVVAKRGFNLRLGDFLKQGSFARKSYKISAVFFLMLSLFTRHGATKADYYLALNNYHKKSKYYRRLQRELKAAQSRAAKPVYNAFAGKHVRHLRNRNSFSKFKNNMPENIRPTLKARAFFENLYYLFLTRLAGMGQITRSFGKTKLFFLRKPWHQRVSSIALKENMAHRKYYLRDVRLRNRSLYSMFYLKDITTLAQRIYGRKPYFEISQRLQQEKKKKN